MAASRLRARGMKGGRGMTLVEVVVSFAMLLVLTAGFAAYLAAASRVNAQAAARDAELFAAEAALVGASGQSGTLTLRYDGRSEDVPVTYYEVSGGGAALRRFAP